KALRMAEDAGLDLVEVAPNSRPPVCRILDYGKFKYEQKKKARGKPKSTSSVLKEIRVRPKIDVNDVAIKVRKARQFLEAGNKVQVTCLSRGREMAYQSLGRDVLMRVVEMLSDLARLERTPRMEGRRMNLLLARIPGAQSKPTKAEESAVDDGSQRQESYEPEPAEAESTVTSDGETSEAESAPAAEPEATAEPEAAAAPQPAESTTAPTTAPKPEKEAGD
ncbi:MAG: translation initiation factor IF-3, partial [Planctomycetes bacterium]|nr:translation initiation factor IF-3 [Planctomycetota bacterium]